MISKTSISLQNIVKTFKNRYIPLFKIFFLSLLTLHLAYGQDLGLPPLKQAPIPSWVKPGLVVYYRQEGGSGAGGSGSYLVMSTAYVVYDIEGSRVLGIEIQASKMGIMMNPKVLGIGGDGLFWIDPRAALTLLSPEYREEARRQGIAISGQPGLIAIDYSSPGKGTTKAVIRYDTRSGLILDFENASWSGTGATRGSTVTKSSYLQTSQTYLPIFPSLPPAAKMGASYTMQIQEQYTGMMVPGGKLTIQPLSFTRKLAQYRITPFDPNTGMALPSKDGWGIALMGPHYVHPGLLRGTTITLDKIGISIVARGNTITTYWNGSPWGSSTIDPRTGLILSSWSRTYGGITYINLAR